MQNKLFHIPVFSLILFSMPVLVSCGVLDDATILEQPVQSTEIPKSKEVVAENSSSSVTNSTQVIPPTLTTVPSSTPSPTKVVISTNSPIPTFTPSITPSKTTAPDIALTTTALAIDDPIDRNCPDPSPAKPEFMHYYLNGDKWPTPEESAEEHYWLSKPLPGGGRLLYTDWYPYGYDVGGRYLIHNGLDVAEPEGTPLLAAADGTVVVAGDDFSRNYGWRCDWYGHLVVIKLDRRWRDQPVYILYGHVLKIEVDPGQHVSRGQKVAEVGVGGAATLAHLHFEIRVGTNEFSSTRNPLLWLEPPSTRGVVAGRLVDPEGRPWQGVAINAVGRSEGTNNQTTWTYLDDTNHLIHPDEGFAENFVIGDLVPGEYDIYLELQSEIYRQAVHVEGGGLTLAEIITEPFKTNTPTPIVVEEITTTPTPSP